MRRRAVKLSAHSPAHRRASRHAWTIALLYTSLAILWVVGSDQLLHAFIDNHDHLLILQTIKGAIFMSVTMLVIYLLVYRRMIIILKSHESLRMTHAHLRAIFEASPLAIFTLNPQGRIGLWNAAATRMFGWSREEITGKPYPAVPEEEWTRFVQMRQRVLAGEYLYDMPARRLCKDGKIIDVSICTAPLFGDGNQIVDTMVIIADVTAHKHARNIERERDSLRARTGAMEEVLGVVGHELRTPLASLQAISEVLLTEKNIELDQRERLVKAINDETIRMAGMVTNMLEAARMDSGKARWHWSVVDVGVLCKDTAEVIRPLVDSSRVSLVSETEPGRFMMKGDEDAIRRLLMNLTSNAHKNTQEGSIRIEARSMYDEHGRWVVLSVTDTGKGISKAAAKGLGRAFALNQGVIGHQNIHTGAGLGLAICRGIVAAHGGRMAVCSSPGKGTTFTVALRSDLAEPVQAAQEPAIVQQVADAATLLA